MWDTIKFTTSAYKDARRRRKQARDRERVLKNDRKLPEPSEEKSHTNPEGTYKIKPKEIHTKTHHKVAKKKKKPKLNTKRQS